VSQRPLAHPLYRLIDISPDLAVAAKHVAAVRRLDDDSCVVFMVGQSAVDGGFKVERPWDEVISDVNDELERAVEEAGEYEDDEDADEDDDNPKEDQPNGD
jgi:hypothetical protein